MILHLCYDNPFIDQSASVFEHFYPNCNFFCISPMGSNKERISRMNDAIWLERNNVKVKEIQSLYAEKQFDTIILHGLNPSFLTILNIINSSKKCRVFWLFYGFELYYALGERTDYPLMDTVSLFSRRSWVSPTKYNYWLRKLYGKTVYYDLLQKTLPFINYFCFWLYEDYLLLQKYFNVNIQYRHFQYGARYKNDQIEISKLNYDKTPYEIRIGHSASKTENQDTIIKLLSKIDKDNKYKKVFPLSYGSIYMRKQVIKMGRKYFGNQFEPILTHVERNQYYESLSKTGVAIFGQNRQEAAGNIGPLLNYGAKVFLRENNVMLKYYKDKGYIIFSVEKDLKSVDDLQPLTPQQMEHNAEIGRNTRVFYEDFMPHLLDD